MTLKFNWWHWKTKWHLFYTTFSFVHHFKAMGEFKLELQFGNAQFESKSAFFCLVSDTAKLTGPRSSTDEKVGGPVKNMRGPIKLLYVIMFNILKSCQKWIFGPVKHEKFLRCLSCDLEIWQMTMKNYRVPLLCCFRLCASFHSHWWIQAGVTVRKLPIWVKINNSFYHVTLKFDGWPWEMIEHLF